MFNKLFKKIMKKKKKMMKINKNNHPNNQFIIYKRILFRNKKSLEQYLKRKYNKERKNFIIYQIVVKYQDIIILVIYKMKIH